MASSNTTKKIAVAAIMAALANILALLSIPIPLPTFQPRLHLIQLPILLAGILAGPWAGAVAGGAGALLTAAQVRIPFILGGNAILGGVAGYLSWRGLRPFPAAVLALVVELPYVAVTDSLYLPLPVIATILVLLSAETLISAALIEALMRSSAVKNLKATLRA